MKTTKKKLFTIHTWFLLIYYLLYPYIANIHQLPLNFIVIPFLIGLIITLLFFYILWRILKNILTTSLILSAVLIFLFSYSLVFSLFEKYLFNKFPHRVNLISQLWFTQIFFFCLLAISIILIIRLSKQKRNFLPIITQFMNATSIILILSTLLILSVKFPIIKSANEFKTNWNLSLQEQSGLQELSNNPKRDIYLIILDGYGSHEVISELYGYDNSWFEEELKNIGFAIIPNGRSNYSQTKTAVSSILNMQYLDDVSETIGNNSPNSHPYREMINNSIVVSNLQKKGYLVTNISSEYDFTREIKADSYVNNGVYLNNYLQALLLNSSLYPFFHQQLFDWHRQYIINTFKNLSNYQTGNQPHIIISHIFTPHPPFVFNNNGEDITPSYRYVTNDADTLINLTSAEYYKEHYPQQLEYISTLTIQTIKAIIANSKIQPIIILCGDHGPGLSVSHNDLEKTNYYERMHILDALYLPGINQDKIPKEITPVNIFRLVFNNYFSANFPYLEDRLYYATYIKPNEFIDVTEKAKTNLYINN